MRKVIAGINMTIDGYCDHTHVDPDEEVHDHYSGILKEAGVILYGRKTYELMQFWQPLLTQPSGVQSMDTFAKAIDGVPKIVFTHTLSDSGWDTATIAKKELKELVTELKQQPGADILVGSRSLIIQLLKLQLLDELQLCIHPVIAGGGLPLFEDIKDRQVLQLVRTKTMGGGAVILYYTRE